MSCLCGRPPGAATALPVVIGSELHGCVLTMTVCVCVVAAWAQDLVAAAEVAEAACL